jgi:hypothetical protein
VNVLRAQVRTVRVRFGGLKLDMTTHLQRDGIDLGTHLVYWYLLAMNLRLSPEIYCVDLNQRM